MTRKSSPRHVASFSGSAADVWRGLKESHPKASDSELLLILTRSQTDPFEVAMQQYEAFRELAQNALKPGEYATIPMFSAVLRKIHYADLDPDVVFRALQAAVDQNLQGILTNERKPPAQAKLPSLAQEAR